MTYRTLISAVQLSERQKAADLIVVDCRYDLMDAEAGHRDWLSGHIPGAVYASVSHDLSSKPVTDHGRHPMPSPETMIKTFSKLGIDSSKQVVVYDNAGGAFAARLWWMLRYMGHDAVAVLDGGWPAWQALGLKEATGEELNVATQFIGSARPEQLVLLADVMTSALLVDSRDPDRYQGKLEPIDPAAGHIPGAKNHFWKLNLDASGQFLPEDKLADQFTKLMGTTTSDDVVFYCGSGVTACHNVLAVTHAGLSEPRLYGGSWSEWSADKTRPVATGDAP
ncbi:probable 3-mercaptopyruvate sulfurtransferase [Artemia franciscana]|uniref:Rhodanese domain-containing protein n=1 Tax=Artemia franciscana TaxID=6661 RepID=A0AA88H125_ARTSF|nr:hypothetical protein QYM36_019553 [Artemia franciscana]